LKQRRSLLAEQGKEEKKIDRKGCALASEGKGKDESERGIKKKRKSSIRQRKVKKTKGGGRLPR